MNKGYSSPEQSLFRFLEIHIFAAALPRILDIQISASQSQITALQLPFSEQGKVQPSPDSASLRSLHSFRVGLQIFKEISISIEPLLGKQKIT